MASLVHALQEEADDAVKVTEENQKYHARLLLLPWPIA
jgi:hypothetical protein